VTGPGRAHRRGPSATAWLAAFGGLVALATVATIPLSILANENVDGLIALVIGIPAAAVGVVVARRQPRNPLGWLLLAIGTCLVLANDGSDYALLAYRLGHRLPLGLLALGLNQLWGPAIELFGLVILLFPDGRLASRLWGWALKAYCTILAFEVIALAVATAEAFAGRPVHVDSTGGLAATDNPAGWYAASLHIGLLALLALILSFIGRQVLSWRRSSGERRQQLKWLASGAAGTVCCAVLGFAAQSAPSALVRSVGGLAWFGFAALPVSIGVGILKYRLYEIDRIISRTLAYAVVTGLLVGVYAGLVLLATRVLTVHTPVAVAASTLAAAALFSPVRRRVQRAVDRRFNRARYDADRTMAAFATRLQDAVDLDTVRDDLAAAVQAVLEPAHVSVWVAAPAADTARRLPRGGLAGPVGRDVEPVSAGPAVAVAP
jgi:hypothetical protein